MTKDSQNLQDFNPHLPRRRWHTHISNRLQGMPISIHTFLTEGDGFYPCIWEPQTISIHTFLAEGDYSVFLLCASHSHFNPHLPRGRWLFRKPVCASAIGFQSTPSSRKVTLRSCSLCHVYLHFNPHLPRGRWLWKWVFSINYKYFNPHLPRGRWPVEEKLYGMSEQFQSTPSSRKVTFQCIEFYAITAYFNPHLPRGRWRLIFILIFGLIQISIHTFLAEGDQSITTNSFMVWQFQSTPSSRKVTFLFLPSFCNSLDFNPHLPRGRWLNLQLALLGATPISIHTFLAEGECCQRFPLQDFL